MLERIKKTPEEFHNALLQGLTVRRYGAYAEDIFYDSMTHHTFRCVDIAKDLPEGESYSLDQVILRDLSHDFTEIVIDDFTAIEKEDEHLLGGLETLEREAAKIVHSPEQQQWLEEFNLAGKMLKGERIETLPPPEALIAKVIDTVENDEYFHLVLSGWMRSEQYDPEKIPTEQALSYTFRKTPTQIQSISESDYPDEVKDLCLSLLRGKLETVQNIWSTVSDELVPGTIKQGLEGITDLLESEGGRM